MSATVPRDWGAIKALFFRALDLAPDERAAFLERECGADAVLRAEVQSLLAAHDDQRPFLDVPPVAGAAQALSTALDERDVRATPLPPGTRIGQYEVLDSVGSGGMGDVYRARDSRLHRFVALKIVVDRSARTGDRVLREARAASALNHPNICTLYEAGEVEGQPYLAMEYIAGRPLSSLIPSDGFEPADVVKYAVQIADALAHAHQHGVIHRDLKGANVVVTPEGRAKVLDFGIARRVDIVGAGVDSGTFTASGTISGTLAYMAPELLRDHQADARSDIWALGVLLYELAAGRRPFVGDTAFEVTSAILKEAPPPLSAKVPASLHAVILRCLERDPAARFQRVSDVVKELETFGATPHAAAMTHRPARRAVLGFGVLAALLLTAYAVSQWSGRTTKATASSGVSGVSRQYTRNPKAHALYVRGRAELTRNRETDIAAAVRSFEEALQQDGDYPLAHAGLALASARMRLFFAKEDEVQAWESRAHQAAQRAIALAAELGESHEALAAVFRSTEFKWADTIAASAAALDRNPDLDQPHLFLASAFMHLGLLDRAHAEAQAAMGLNRANNAEALRIQGVAAMYGGRFEAAGPLLARAAAESETPTEWNLAYALYNAGRTTEAEAMLRKRAAQGGSVRTQRRAQATLASFLAARGEAKEARELIDVVLAGSYVEHHVAYALGVTYAQLDMTKEALEQLSEARNTGFPCYPWFEADPLLKRFRQRPESRRFFDEFRRSWETMKSQYAVGS